MRRDLRIDEIPYPVITTVMKTTKQSSTGFGELRCRQIHMAPPKAKNMNRKPRIWCQSEWTGFTAAGKTCLTKRPDWRANWPDWWADGIQRRARRPATRPSCCGLATPQCYQTGPGYQASASLQYCSKGFCSVQSRDWRFQPTRQPMALNVHLYKRVAPEERGRTWKSV
jgi:hypothetical protein